MDSRHVYSLGTLAERWTCSAEMVRQLIVTGKLQGFRFGKMWRISAAEVDRFEGVPDAAAAEEMASAPHAAPRPPVPAVARREVITPQSLRGIPDWPGAMKRKTAAAYLDLAEAAFEREVAAGRLPPSFILGGRPHWQKMALDKALTMLLGGEGDGVPDHIRRFEERHGLRGGAISE